MNILEKLSVTDIVLTLIAVFFLARGIIKGFSGEVISLISVAGGFFCAIKFYAPIASILTDNLGLSRVIATIITMLGIFFVIFFGCTYLEWSVKKVIEKTKLTSTDKLFGAIIGLIKFYIITVMVLLGSMIIAPMAGDTWAKESRILTVTSFTWPLISPPLDKAGLIPDLASIQNEAREYVIRQAGKSLLGASGDAGLLGASADVYGVLSGTSADLLGIYGIITSGDDQAGQ